MKIDKVVTSLLTLSLAACSSGGSNESTPSTAATIKTGVFIDSPVINIGYKTETQEGVTNAAGEYLYQEGESVTFFIGDLKFPSAKAKQTITPLDLAQAKITTAPKVLNIIRLLQSLDKDGNPANGITITETAKATATQVNFDFSTSDFQSSSAVVSLVSNAGQDTAVTALIDQNTAVLHLNQQLEANGISPPFPLDLTGKNASSVITRSGCTTGQGGWNYTFKTSEVIATGTDTFQPVGGIYGGACTLGVSETLTFSIPSPFDTPFNCEAYPICTESDFNKTESGTDADGRSFTATYSFDKKSNQLTASKTVQQAVFTEVITFDLQ